MCSSSAQTLLTSLENELGIGGYFPRTIFMARPFMSFASKACLSVVIS